MTKANDYFGTSNGAGQYYAHHQTGLTYTEGVRDLIKECRVSWLLDLITNHNANPNTPYEDFQAWDVIRSRDCMFDVIVTNNVKRIIASHQVEWCDFPYDTATIWVKGNVILLPVEYDSHTSFLKGVGANNKPTKEVNPTHELFDLMIDVYYNGI